MASGRLINPAFHTGAMTMSDIITSPFDAAIDTLRERERNLDTEAQSLIIRRDEVREMIAVLTSRKPRAPRKPRAMTEAAPVTTEEAAPRPGVFAAPFSVVAPDAAEAA
jgi:hypothetical protein